MWMLLTIRLLLTALCLCQISSVVQALPQGNQRLASAPTSRQSNLSNRGSILSILAKSKKYDLPHISNPRLRPFCDLNLEDAQVCPSNQACVEDPWQTESKLNSYTNQRSAKLGVCTSTDSENMCGGFAGTARRCQNFNSGWQCAKPSRCDRENISDCDWLCVQPPPATLVGGKGFQGV